ncbi:MAG TPA: DNA N-6-adenine-methyltransferase [Polyangiaceae bacterium]
MVARARKPPAQKPGSSKQDYSTPRSFLNGVERRFGPIKWDLAAHEKNAVCDLWIGERQNSLVHDWHQLDGWLFLNPPLGDIAPWAKKCAVEAAKGARILFLTPASSGSNWFQDHLVRHGYVLDLAPRLSFDGKAPFPKDLVLTVFAHGLVGRGFWRWA